VDNNNSIRVVVVGVRDS